MLRNFPSDQHPGRGGDTRWGWMETILWEPDKLCLLIQLPLVPVCNTPQRPWEAKWMCRIPSHPSSTVDQTHLHYWFHHEVNKSLVLWDAAFLTIKAQVLRESQAPLTVPSLGKIFRTTGFSGCVSPCVVNFRGICNSETSSWEPSEEAPPPREAKETRYIIDNSSTNMLKLLVAAYIFSFWNY